MNRYLKTFLHRGLCFSGFGPVILSIVYIILEKSLENFEISGFQVFTGVVSTYILAFVQAGVSVFNQIEEWSIVKSTFFHFGLLYITYVVCYLINSWIPFKIEVILIFTISFIILYFVIWLIVYLIIKSLSKKLNKKIG